MRREDGTTSSGRVSGRLGPVLRGWARALEEERSLEPLGAALARVGGGLGRRPGLRRALRGEWLGHALHPLMTDFALGAWMSTSLLDLFGGDDAARRAEGLLVFGLAAAVPTVATGLVEAAETDARSRRVAAAHASVNATAFALYAASLAARRRGRRGAATGLGVAGGVVATAGGYLGGHLSFVLGMGVDHGAPPAEAAGADGGELQRAQTSSEPEVDAEARRMEAPSQAEGGRGSARRGK